jgi:hypothetical protein
MTFEAHATSEKRNEELYLQMKELFNLQLQMTRKLNDELVSLYATLENANQTPIKASTELPQTGKCLVTDISKSIKGVSEQFGTYDSKELTTNEVT